MEIRRESSNLSVAFLSCPVRCGSVLWGQAQRGVVKLGKELF